MIPIDHYMVPDHRKVLQFYFILAFLSVALAAVPWHPWWSWRFSLRTMLIVTALVAVVLGMVVWLTR